MQNARDDLRDAREHAREAAAATLKAMRTALDGLINRLDRGDGDNERGDHGAVPPEARPGETPMEDDGKVL